MKEMDGLVVRQAIYFVLCRGPVYWINKRKTGPSLKAGVIYIGWKPSKAQTFPPSPLIVATKQSIPVFSGVKTIPTSVAMCIPSELMETSSLDPHLMFSINQCLVVELSVLCASHQKKWHLNVSYSPEHSDFLQMSREWTHACQLT